MTGLRLHGDTTSGGLSMFVIIAMVLIVAIGAFAYFLSSSKMKPRKFTTTIRMRDQMVEKADLSKTMITRLAVGQ